jgi:hypothetical protein
MPRSPARKLAQEAPPLIEREFPPLRSEGIDLAVRVTARLADDGVWRGRFTFGDFDPPCRTAEILCAATESDLWAAARGLGPHHLRDLFRSLR